MKKLEDIEKKLRNNNLPETDISSICFQEWQRILKTHKEKQKLSLIFKTTPWLWTLASILLIVLCIIIMFLLKNVK